MKIKKGDSVIVIAGKEKGKTAIVAQALPRVNKVILEGLNQVKKHTRPTAAGAKGGIVLVSQPLNVSNVKLSASSVKEAAPIVKKTAKKVAKKAE